MSNGKFHAIPPYVRTAIQLNPIDAPLTTSTKPVVLTDLMRHVYEFAPVVLATTFGADEKVLPKLTVVSPPADDDDVPEPVSKSTLP